MISRRTAVFAAGLAGLIVAFVSLAVRAEPAATTQPAAAAQAPSGELMQDKSARAAYGAEVYRIVDQKGEIVSVLRNGMTVIVRHVASPVVSVRGIALTGGVYEGKWLGGGLSHLLEHLVAGGSNGRRTEAQNRDLLQRLGNNSNAYTTEDHTAFFVNTTPEHMEEAVDLVTGWMLTASITPAEYRREYQVVQRELEMGKGEPDRQFYYLAEMNRYKVSPARVPVIGYQEVIQGLSRDDVYSYYKQAYQPNNMVFLVAGDLEPGEMLKAVQKNVAEAPPGRVFSHDIAPEPAVQTPRAQVATFPKLGQARIMLGFPGVRIDNPDMYALDLLAEAIGSGESSLLNEEIRDKQELVSSIGASDDTPTYADGTFAVEMLVDPDKVQQSSAAVLAILEKIKTDGIDADRLRRAKTGMRAAALKRLLTAESVTESLGDDFLGTGDADFSDRYVGRIEKVTPEEIKLVANKYFDRERLLTTALLPAEWAGAKGLPKAEELIRPVVPSTAPAVAAAAPSHPIERTELENGTTLLIKRIAGAPVINIQMYSLGGVASEDASTNGLGNLTMQMLPRGTRTQSAGQIAEFFDATGAEMETACGNNSWYWKASCLPADFSRTLKVYAGIVNEPSFPDSELALMKKRIEAQIQSEDADWSAQAIRFFKAQYFGPMKSPYQFLPIGAIPNVAGFSGEQVQRWYQQKILGSRRVLAIFGDVDPDQARSLASSLLGRGRQLSSPATRPVVAPEAAPEQPGAQAVADVRRVAVQKTEQPLAGVVVGYDAASYVTDPAQPTMSVIQTITGGFNYPTGYLFETLRGKGLVYVVAAENWPGREPGLPGTFLVYAGCDPKNVNEVVDLILQNMARVQGSPQDINESWFKRAKELIVVADAMEHETPDQQATSAALDELYGLGYAWHDGFADKVRAVELPAVQDTARRRLSRCVVTICTPAPELVKVHEGVRQYESFPPVDLTPRGVQHDTGAAGPK